jgi:hypothetical protein
MTNSDENNSTIIAICNRGDLVEFTVSAVKDSTGVTLRRAGILLGAMAAGAIASCGCQVILKQDRQPESQ